MDSGNSGWISGWIPVECRRTSNKRYEIPEILGGFQVDSKHNISFLQYLNCLVHLVGIRYILVFDGASGWNSIWCIWSELYTPPPPSPGGSYPVWRNGRIPGGIEIIWVKTQNYPGIPCIPGGFLEN